MGEAEEGVKNSTLREISIGKALNHPNIVKLIETCPVPTENCVYCIYELMNIDLRQYMKQVNGNIPESTIKIIMK